MAVVLLLLLTLILQLLELAVLTAAVCLQGSKARMATIEAQKQEDVARLQQLQREQASKLEQARKEVGSLAREACCVWLFTQQRAC